MAVDFFEDANQLISGQVFLINKPYKWTSFDVVRKLKGALSAYYKSFHSGESEIRKLKIGHAGTLDPLATGLLILCTGAYTKKISDIQDAEKEYTGTIVLGGNTDSHDLESIVIPRNNVQMPETDAIHSAAQNFLGKQMQTPPAHSAVKVGGKRAYQLARQGKEVEIKPKEIEIKAFEITRIELPSIDFRVVCTKGTYIRTLAYDFGEVLCTGAYLSALCRTRIGEYKLEDALDPLLFARQITDNQVL
ncbi:MAG: tRNA pseudouridine(55) synthase TruB [Bacteroidetes bacterium]|nr:tRNA pseudouridine(55) synthase TruB [Bacteroidota bacterium]